MFYLRSRPRPAHFESLNRDIPAFGINGIAMNGGKGVQQFLLARKGTRGAERHPPSVSGPNLDFHNNQDTELGAL